MKRVIRKSEYRDPETGEMRREETSNLEDTPVTQTGYTNQTGYVTYYDNWGRAVVLDILAIIEVLLLFRFLLLLFGAHLGSFSRFIYSVTEVLVAPFRSTFALPNFGVSTFSGTTIIAMIVYAVIAWIIVALIDLAAQRQANYCVGPNCPVQ